VPRSIAYLVVFVASACTLILEILAGRILAPFIGVSLYTWTSIIGVVLAGISLGNYLGGRIADRWPQRRTLGILLLAGGFASLAILPLINIATAIPSGDLVDVNNRLGGVLPLDRAALLILRIVLITALIFFPPSLILGMVSPVVIKLTLRDLAHSGGLVGKVYALSTLGSIIGTFATGFVLIDLFGTRMIVLGVGIVLVGMAIVFGDVLRVGRAAAPLAAGLVLVALLVPARNVRAYGCLDGSGLSADCVQRSVSDGWDQATNSGCLHETAYYCIRVADAPGASSNVKELILDHLVHSYNKLDDPNYLEYGYIKVYAEIADYLAQRVPNQALRVLYIGGGGYTLARHIEATYPNARQEIMEIDPGVTRTVYEQLGVDPASTHIVTYNVDGRLMLNQLVAQGGAGQYDLVIGDAFNDLSIPYHLTTLEFDQQVKRVLKPGGFYLALVIDKMAGGKFIPAYTSTVLQAWPAVQVLADSDTFAASSASTFVVAAGDEAVLPDRLSGVRGQGAAGAVTTHIMNGEAMHKWLDDAHAPVLTDDYAPVDNLIAPIFAERGF
jgi:spermidine synthase